MAQVLHIIDTDSPDEMLRQLRVLADDGDTIVRIGRPPRYARLGLPVRTVHCPLGMPRLAGPRIRRMVQHVPVIHAWSQATARVAIDLRGRLRAGTVLSWPSSPLGRDVPLLVKLTCDEGVHLTVPTEAARLRLLAGGAAEPFVHILPPPARLLAREDISRRRKRIRAALGLSDRQRLLVAPGDMIRGAGHKYASWVHGILRRIVEDLFLLMPADGPALRSARAFAATTGYGREIFFGDDLSQRTGGSRLGRTDALCAADVAVLPFEHDIGSSALAETMALGLPIAASETPDTAELAPHGDCALLSPPADPRVMAANVLKLVEDRPAARKIAANARRRAKKQFDVERIRNMLAETYAAAAAAAPSKMAKS